MCNEAYYIYPRNVKHIPYVIHICQYLSGIFLNWFVKSNFGPQIDQKYRPNLAQILDYSV